MEILQYLLTGATLGLVAGISPGPILALVIRESLQNGRKAGMKVATVPLFSDLPIVLLTILILTRLTEYNTILGIISFLGAGFILLLAYESIMVKPIQADIKAPKFTTFWKGVFANLLSPHPYLYWLLVTGYWLLVTGYWLLVTGYWLLERQTLKLVKLFFPFDPKECIYTNKTNYIMLHKDSKVWKEAMLLAAQIYEFVKKLPDSERYGLISQMQRAAVSVPSNIAEGAGRGSKKEYIRFLRISLSSLNEIETQYYLCLLVTKVEEEFKIEKKMDYLGRLLSNTIESLSK